MRIQKCFLDTCTLIKLYHEEEGTEKISKLIELEKPEIIISELTRFEMISVFANKVRTKEIRKKTFYQVVEAFENDIDKFSIVNFDDLVRNKSLDLLKNISYNKSLRTLDAIQLASGIIAFELFNAELFISSDKVLLSIARSILSNTLYI
jgi:predicted nucleic acid-binding protein